MLILDHYLLYRSLLTIIWWKLSCPSDLKFLLLMNSFWLPVVTVQILKSYLIKVAVQIKGLNGGNLKLQIKEDTSKDTVTNLETIFTMFWQRDFFMFGIYFQDNLFILQNFKFICLFNKKKKTKISENIANNVVISFLFFFFSFIRARVQLEVRKHMFSILSV